MVASGADARMANWRARYPILRDLVPMARRRLPGFVADYVFGGTGAESGDARNARALDAVELLPEICPDIAAIDPSVTLFGSTLSSPLASAPIGLDGAIWPGASEHVARACARAGLASMAGTLSSSSLEAMTAANPEKSWFQLYTIPGEDHRVSFDLLRRAEEAGARMAAVTVDIPLPGRRVRDMRNRLQQPMRITPRVALGAVSRPAWLAATLRAGTPACVNMSPYAGTGGIDAFMATARAGGGLSWDVLARLRDGFSGPMLLKGVTHPEDARKARAAGYEGVIVSNHGGRQFDCGPAAIDLLPAIRAAMGPEAPVLYDGAIWSGLDMLKAVALGADAVLAGRAFLIGIAALGPQGAAHVCHVLTEEFRIALGQSGAVNIEGARRLASRHPGCWRPEELERPHDPWPEKETS